MAVWPISPGIIIIVIIIPLSVYPYSNYVRKCCAQGSSLNTTTSHEAYCSENNHQWLYMNFTYGLPNCNYTVIPAVEDDQISCIDNFLSEDTVKAVKCAEPIDEPNIFKVPPVNYIRKCCPLHRPYDTTTQSCWSPNITDHNHTQDLINILIPGYDGVVDINMDILQCDADQALVDTLVWYNRTTRATSGAIVINLMDVNQTKIILNPDESCVDLTEINDTLIVRMCQHASTACRPYGNHTCIRKCCPNGQVYIDKKCTPSNHTIVSFKSFYVPGYNKMTVVNTTPAFLFGDICKYQKYLADEADYLLDVNGYLHTEGQVTNNYCIEHVENRNESDNISDGDYTFPCFPDNSDIVRSGHTIFNAINMIISCVFFFFTLVVYSCLQQLRNLHGKTLMCHVSCLLVAYSCLVYVQLTSNPNTGPTTCAALGFVIQFTFLAAFSWLNVISFDIWWTFGSLQPAIGKKARDRRRFILYSAYAWSVSSLITGAAIVADHTDILPDFLRPSIGDTTCWFSTHTNGMFIFFTTPECILFAMNLIFYTLTAIRCSKIKNELHKLAHSSLAERRFRSDKRKLVMNLKLFIVMGVTWTLEVISVLTGPVEMWSVSDAANALQGLLIFAIFVLKKRVLKAFWQRVKEVICREKPRHHRPSCSTLFTMTASEARISSAAVNLTPSAISSNHNHHHLKKSTSDSRLAVLSVGSSPAAKRRQHQRCSSSSSTNRLNVNNNNHHNFWSKPG